MKYKDIRLRALEPEDLELLYGWENNETYWTTGQAPIDEAEFEKRVRQFFGQGNDFAKRYL